MTSNNSLSADQPQHEACKAVDLAAMDVLVCVNQEHPHPAEIHLSIVEIQNTAMDEYGTGYTLEVKSGQKWKKSSLSRRSFGVDIFHLEMESSSRMSVEVDNGEVAGFANIRMSARVWHWTGDEEIARNALLKAVNFSLDKQTEFMNDLKLKTVQAGIGPLPEVAPPKPAKKSARP